MLRMAIGLTAVLAPLQLIIGDQHGLNTLEVSADQDRGDRGALGRLQAGRLPHLRLAGREDREQPLRAVDPERLLAPAHASLERSVPGPEKRAAADRPPVPVVFFAFRVMVGLGLLMIAAALFGAFLWWRGTLFTTRWYLAVMAQCWWVGFVAVMAGWITTESGRQPWIVDNILRTADANSPVIGAEHRRARWCCSSRLWRRVLLRHLLHQPPDRPRAGTSAGTGRPHRRARRSPPRMAAASRCAKTGGSVMEWYLPVIWAGLIGTAVAMYVILDGFDLGIGILFPFAANERQRDQMMALGGAVLGRQRDLADPRRRRPVRRLPARLRGDHAGALFARDRDAAGAGVPRRGVRIPHRRRAARPGSTSPSPRARRSPLSRKA